MRPIKYIGKYRGKRKDSGEWVYGMAFCDKGKTFVITNIISQTSKTEFIVDVHEIDPDTLGQFSGLKDTADDDICEGDILDLGAASFEHWCVKFKKGKFILYSKDCREVFFPPKCYEIKIVGNIHDNPELLKGDTNERN